MKGLAMSKREIDTTTLNRYERRAKKALTKVENFLDGGIPANHADLVTEAKALASRLSTSARNVRELVWALREKAKFESELEKLRDENMGLAGELSLGAEVLEKLKEELETTNAAYAVLKRDLEHETQERKELERGNDSGLGLRFAALKFIDDLNAALSVETEKPGELNAAAFKRILPLVQEFKARVETPFVGADFAEAEKRCIASLTDGQRKELEAEAAADLKERQEEYDAERIAGIAAGVDEDRKRHNVEAVQERLDVGDLDGALMAYAEHATTDND